MQQRQDSPYPDQPKASVRRPRLLAVDDDPLILKLLQAVFARQDFDVYIAESGVDALTVLQQQTPDIAIIDMGLPDMDGLTLLEHMRERRVSMPVLVLTANEEVATAVRAMQLGARNYLLKPVNADELLLNVRRALEHQSLVTEVEDLRRKTRSLTLAEQMGPSLEVMRVIEQEKTVAPSNLTVLIQGETGSGKELVATAIHRDSPRADRPFIAVDCGAIPEALIESELFGHEKGAFTGADRRRVGQFQLAEGGTLFLDEIGNLPASLQPKLLRALESRQVTPVGGEKKTVLDIRFVAATNFDLQQRVRDGQFREDLYFRLAQYVIPLPPLRARLSDIPHLAQRFMEEACREMKRPVVEITSEAIAELQKHSWPGNVRELRNVIRQAVLNSRTMIIHDAAIQFVMSGTPDRRAPLGRAPEVEIEGRSLKEAAEAATQDAEIAAIRAALRKAGGNKAAAAKALKTDYKTLHVKIQKYGIRAAEYKK